VGSTWAGILTTAPKGQAQFELRTAVKWLSLVATQLDVTGLKAANEAKTMVWLKVWLKTGGYGHKEKRVTALRAVTH
jgi:hypothetical protein